jgi:hypothetical protein
MSDNQSICVNCHSKIPESGLICPHCRMDPRIYGSLPMSLGPPPPSEGGCGMMIAYLLFFAAVAWATWKVMF